MKKLLLAAVAALAMTGAAQAADETPLWRMVGDAWQVRVDPTLGHGCFMMAVYGQQAFRVGFDNRTNTTYMVLLDLRWNTMESGKTYDIGVRFSGMQAPAQWHAQATLFDGHMQLVITNIGKEVWPLISERVAFFVYYQDHQIMGLNMKGTVEAVRETMNCNQTFVTNGSSPGTNASVEANPFISH